MKLRSIYRVSVKQMVDIIIIIILIIIIRNLNNKTPENILLTWNYYYYKSSEFVFVDIFYTAKHDIN